MPGLKAVILLVVCSVLADAVKHKNYTMKCELLIGGIRFMRIFVVDCVAPQTGSYACSISIYGNSFPFLF